MISKLGIHDQNGTDSKRCMSQATPSLTHGNWNGSPLALLGVRTKKGLN